MIIGHVVDVAEQAPELLRGGLLLMGRVDDDLLADEEQPGQLPRDQDRAFAVLARDDQADIGTGPFPVRPLA